MGETAAEAISDLDKRSPEEIALTRADMRAYGLTLKDVRSVVTRGNEAASLACGTREPDSRLDRPGSQCHNDFRCVRVLCEWSVRQEKGGCEMNRYSKVAMVAAILVCAPLLLGQTMCVPPTCQPVGTWDFEYDWDCDGTVGNSTWDTYADGTFQSRADPDYYGTWVLVGSIFTLTYQPGVGGAIYTGTCTGATMAGTMVGPSPFGLTGCWTAVKVAKAGGASLDGSADESGG